MPDFARATRTQSRVIEFTLKNVQNPFNTTRKTYFCVILARCRAAKMMLQACQAHHRLQHENCCRTPEDEKHDQVVFLILKIER
jgi:hypothetical protein